MWLIRRLTTWRVVVCLLKDTYIPGGSRAPRQTACSHWSKVGYPRQVIPSLSHDCLHDWLTPLVLLRTAGLCSVLSVLPTVPILVSIKTEKLSICWYFVNRKLGLGRMKFVWITFPIAVKITNLFLFVQYTGLLWLWYCRIWFSTRMRKNAARHVFPKT